MDNLKRFKIISTVLIIIVILIGLFLIFQINSANSDKQLLTLFIIISQVILIFAFLYGYFKGTPFLKQSKRMMDTSRIFYELLQESISVSDYEGFYQTILNKAIEAMGQDCKGSMMLLDTESNKLHFIASSGYELNDLKHTYIDLKQTYLYRESNGKVKGSVVIHDPAGYDRKHLKVENIDLLLEKSDLTAMTTLSTPIFYDGKLYGMINMDSDETSAFDQTDIKLIELFSFEVSQMLKLFSSLEKNNYFINYDSLTNIYNRRYINDYVDYIHEENLKDNKRYSLVSIDLNNLKYTNDKYGHAAGDILLTGFSSTVDEILPDGVTFGRYGGDEFMIILPNYNENETNDVMIEINRVLNELEFIYNDITIFVTFCYGCAVFPKDGRSVKELISKADNRMYEKKKQYHERRKVQ